MERRNIDRNNITSSTQVTNQAQRNYNYQQYGRGINTVVNRVNNLTPNQINGLWEHVGTSYYCYEFENLGTGVYCTQVFNTAHATTRLDSRCIAIAKHYDNDLCGTDINFCTCDDKLIWEVTGSEYCNFIGIAVPADPSAVRIYTYDLTPFQGRIPVINENGEIIG